MTSALRIAGSGTANARYAVGIEPERAGRSHGGPRIGEPEPTGSQTFTGGDGERIVPPLNGGRTVRVHDDDGKDEFQLLGGENVFGGVGGFAYVPRDARAQIASGAGGRFALAGAKCERRLPARYGPAPEVSVEQSGSGTCPRQVHAERRPGEGAEPAEGAADVLAEVRSGDAVPVPEGRHGPSIARPGHDMYYLKVMAGPGERQWRICLRPDHAEGTGGCR